MPSSRDSFRRNRVAPVVNSHFTTFLRAMFAPDLARLRVVSCARPPHAFNPRRNQTVSL